MSEEAVKFLDVIRGGVGNVVFMGTVGRYHLLYSFWIEGIYCSRVGRRGGTMRV